jgi:hypothetical protein
MYFSKLNLVKILKKSEVIAAFSPEYSHVVKANKASNKR